MGGLSRRAYILNKVRQEESKPILVLDAGALLFPQPGIPSSLVTAQSAQAEGVVEAMNKMGYDAFGIASQDLAAGAGFLLGQPEEKQLPWLSLNLVRSSNQQPLFPPYLIRNVGDLAVGVIAVSGNSPKTSSRGVSPDYKVIPWENRLPEVLDEIRDKTDMLILLSSLPEKTNKEIAATYQDIHLILQSGHSKVNKRAQLHNNTLISQIGSRGKYIGRLDIHWGDKGKWWNDASSEIKQTKERLDRINWQIGRLEKRLPPGQVEQNRQYEQLLQQKNDLSEKLLKLERKEKNNKEGFSTYTNNFTSLLVSLPEEPEIREIVLKTKTTVNTTHQQTLRKAEAEKSPTINRAFANLAGWPACQSCHVKQTDFWKQTAHAKAWQTLVLKNQQFNPECLICHVTLPTYDKERVIRDNLLAVFKEEYKGVGCEACHGPSRAHTVRPDLYRPQKPDEKTCLTCHTPERDDNFIFTEKLKKVRCPTADH